MSHLLPVFAAACTAVISAFQPPPPPPIPAGAIESELYMPSDVEILTALQHRRQRRHSPVPLQGGKRITWRWLVEETDDEDCAYRFKFTLSEICQMLKALEIPAIWITDSRHRFSGLEAFCLLCARFRTAGDLGELSIKYRRSTSALSELFNELVIHLDDTWSHLLDFDHNFLLSPPRLAMYSDAIAAVTGILLFIAAWLDCTIRGACRPIYFQRQVYNGHKKFHALKFQALTTPDGMIAHLYGPIEGRRNDNFLLSASGLMRMWRQYAQRPDAPDDTPVQDRYFRIYGDAAYGLSPLLLSPFSRERKGAPRTHEQKQFNRLMGRVRVRVEHAFGRVLTDWPFLRSSWKMRIFQSPVGRYYRVGVLLSNGRNCLRPNGTSRAFNCPPPKLSEYFHH